MAAAGPGAWSAGVVKAVLSGDQLVVVGGGGGERTVTLAGLSAPRQARRDDPNGRDEPYAWQSRDFLRQRCIGQPVTFRVEFSVAAREFCTIFVSAGKQSSVCINALVLINGFARFRLPPGCELSNAAELRAADAAAKEAERGIWGKGEPPVHHVNDASRDLNKARTLLPFLVRAGRTRACVDFVISAGRFKLIIAKENATVVFGLAGVRTPRTPEPGAAEVLALLRTHLTQRDVEVSIETLERTGVFTGALFVPTSASGTASHVSLALLLVGAGLASCVSSVDARPDGRQLRAAEDVARSAEMGLWKDYVAPRRDDGDADDASTAAEEHKVTVTDVRGGGLLYLQLADDPNVARVREALSALPAPGAVPLDGFAPAAGRLCAACFSGDEMWYRGYVLAARGSACDIFFVDFGNTESVPVHRLAPLDAALQSIPSLAHLAALAYVKVPQLGEEFGLDAAQLVGSLTGGGGTLTARVEVRQLVARGELQLRPCASVLTLPRLHGHAGACQARRQVACTQCNAHAASRAPCG